MGASAIATQVGTKEPVLVTGAGGLLGREVVTRLAPYGGVYALFRERPAQLLLQGVTAIGHDLRKPEVPELPKIPGTIVHLAQSSRYRDFPEGAPDVFAISVGSTQRLLDWGVRHGVQRFVYASTGGVYGNGAAPFDEDAPLEGTGSHYAASKRCGELLAEAYRSEMTIIILRFFFIYGPRQNPAMLVPRLVDNVRHGRPIILQSKDGIRLNPIYVSDAAAAVEAAIGLTTSETINVAGPQVLNLREIGTLIGEATGRNPRFELQSDVVPRHMVGATDKMYRLLGVPGINLTEGIGMMLAPKHAAVD